MNLTTILLSGGISLLVSLLIAPLLIKYLTKLKFGQSILEIGPNWHKNKQGTPTMGGFIFIIPTVLVGLTICIISDINSTNIDYRGYIVLIAGILFSTIGFIDDYIKVVKKRNLGLTATQKALMQLIFSLGIIITLKRMNYFDTTVLIPFTNIHLDVSWFYGIPFYIIALLFMVYSVNSVNLTDGIDGLASSVSLPVLVLFIMFSYKIGNFNIAIICCSLIGGLLGFLRYNWNPAKAFMGDTGSMFLGGIITTLAFALDVPLFLLIYGFVFIFEALSVVLQVISFKLTKKRIFKMSPIHHHFELCNWSEKKIVIVFTLVSILGCILAGIGLFNIYS